MATTAGRLYHASNYWHKVILLEAWLHHFNMTILFDILIETRYVEKKVSYNCFVVSHTQ